MPSGNGWSSSVSLIVSARFHHNIHFTAFACAQELKGGATVSCDFQKAHAPQNAKDFSGSTLRVVGAHTCGLTLVSHRDFESRRLRLEECREIFGGDVRNEVSEAVYFQDDAAQCAFINRFWTGSGEADVVGDLVSEAVGLDAFGQVGCNW